MPAATNGLSVWYPLYRLDNHSLIRTDIWDSGAHNVDAESDKLPHNYAGDFLLRKTQLRKIQAIKIKHVMSLEEDYNICQYHSKFRQKAIFN